MDSPLLTKKTWDELFAIFKLHFSTEMPFLHPQSFRNRMRQAANPREPDVTIADIEESRVVLLGVLTLTARFHPGLVAHHSPIEKDPLAASEFYATPLAAAFGPTIRNISVPSLENIQALLMLGLYEWGQTRGLSAWLYVGIAIRLAFSMGLTFEDDPDEGPRQEFPALTDLQRRDRMTDREVRRRTFWGCFIMDRMLAAGKCRPTMITPDKLRVQLPCSDDEFLFVTDVKTGFLSSDWLDDTSMNSISTNNTDDRVLGRYIRLVEIFGRLSEYSYAGGRRTETDPPWNDQTEFFQLRRQLREFNEALPPSLIFTASNLSAHIEKHNATTYASLHTLYSLCLIVLHREYIPFIPIRCTKPVGPLDEPTFPEDKYQIPSGFWEDSAESIMKASADIIYIVNTCQESDVLPESPQIGFAVWQAAFVSVYANYFPHMDMSQHLTTPNDTVDTKFIQRNRFPTLTMKILQGLAPRLKMIKSYIRSIDKMHKYFHEVFCNYFGRFRQKAHGDFPGGGLEQYKMYEKELKEFGDLKDSDTNVPSEGSDVIDNIRSRASTSDLPGTASINGEGMQGIEGASQGRSNGAWAPINANAGSPQAETDERPRYNNYGPPYAMAYLQSPGSNPPSLISPSNGESNSGINSPYNNAQAQMYHQSTQPQHAASYPSVTQHSMAPPNANMIQYDTREHEYGPWIDGMESITMSGFDNFAQDQMNQYNQYSQQHNMNYLAAINGSMPVGGQF